MTISRSLAGVRSKFVPVTDSAVPASAIVGVKLVTVGVPLVAVTVNGVDVVAVPNGTVIDIGPVVAPAGTETTSFDVVAEIIEAAVPLNVTVFCAAVALKPVPLIVTVVPTPPLCGEKSVTPTWPACMREMAMILPTAS